MIAGNGFPSRSGLLCTHVVSAMFLPAVGSPACTVFYVPDGDCAFGGNNEHGTDPDTYVWFVPSDEGSYDRAAPPLEVRESPGKPVYHVAVLDLEEELEKGRHTYEIPSLFEGK